MNDLGSNSICVTYQLNPVYVNFLYTNAVRTVIAHLTPELLGGF